MTSSLSGGYFYTLLMKHYSASHKYFASFCTRGENRWNYRREPWSSTWQLSELLPRHYGHMCLAQSAFKAFGFLNDKLTRGFFFSVEYYLQTAVSVDLFSSFLRSITSVHVNFDFFSIPNKAWQQCAAGCQNSPRQSGFGLLLKTGRDSMQHLAQQHFDQCFN